MRRCLDIVAKNRNDYDILLHTTQTRTCVVAHFNCICCCHIELPVQMQCCYVMWACSLPWFSGSGVSLQLIHPVKVGLQRTTESFTLLTLRFGSVLSLTSSALIWVRFTTSCPTWYGTLQRSLISSPSSSTWCSSETTTTSGEDSSLVSLPSLSLSLWPALSVFWSFVFLLSVSLAQLLSQH